MSSSGNQTHNLSCLQSNACVTDWSSYKILLTKNSFDSPSLALIAKTPYVLRYHLMSAMFGQHLRGCYLFADTGEPFLRQLTVLLDYSVYFPGELFV